MTRNTFLFSRIFSRVTYSSWMALLPFLILCSCVHELPVGERDVAVTLHLQFDYEMPQYKIVDVNSKNIQELEQDYDARYHVWVFSVGLSYDSMADSDKVPAQQLVFTQDEVEFLERDVTLMMPRGLYEVLVWTDFVPKGSREDFFWDTTHPSALTVKPEQLGGNDFRMAYGGRLEVDTRELLENDSRLEGIVAMERPLAKFNFVSTDLDEFRQMYGQVDILTYGVEFSYNGFMASVYNLFKDRTVDSLLGQHFSSSFTVSEAGEVEMGFDYVLVGTRETSVEMNLALYGPSGESLGGTSAVFVPLLRSHLNTVRGKFLSGSQAGGVAIDPSFEGDLNIHIQ